MHTTGIIHHFDHSNMYTNTSSTYIYTRSPCYKFPLLVPSSTYLAPSRCDRNCPPQSQVARKLTPLVPHCSLVPSPPNSQPFLDFPEPSVYLIRAHHKPPSQHTTQYSWYIYIVQLFVPVSHYSWIVFCAFYSLLSVHLFCSLFDYLFCFHPIDSLLIYCSKEKEQF